MQWVQWKRTENCANELIFVKVSKYFVNLDDSYAAYFYTLGLQIILVIYRRRTLSHGPNLWH